MKSRIDRWFVRPLSQGGKKVFIKSVLQAIPTFTMSYFFLLGSLCIELYHIISWFWWQKSGGKRGIHWCVWSQLCASKDFGGMRFRNLSQFNIALLAKQGWRLLKDQSSLLACSLKAKYYPNSNFLKANLGTYPSYTWKSIWSAKGLLLEGLGWQLGTGTNIDIWDDAWVPGLSTRKIQVLSVNMIYKVVAELIMPHDRKWDVEKITSVFAPDVATKIQCIPLALHSHPNLVACRPIPQASILFGA
ncbi:hypothetical protein V6Z12_D04G172900, partial [Gossypium hirsutum]